MKLKLLAILLGAYLLLAGATYLLSIFVKPFGTFLGASGFQLVMTWVWMPLTLIIALVAPATVPSEGVSSVLSLVLAALFVWLGFVLITGRHKTRAKPAQQNLQTGDGAASAFCPNCGQTLPSRLSKFCPFCGFSLGEQAASKAIAPTPSAKPVSAKQVPAKQVTKKMPKPLVAVVVVIIFVILIASLHYSGALDLIFNPTPLTPVANLKGTWKTAFPVKFYIKTDFQTGELQDVGSEDRMMIWVITPTRDENVVDVAVWFTGSNLQLTIDSGYVPDIASDASSPPSWSLKGLISGVFLTLKVQPYVPIGPAVTQMNNGTVGQFTFNSVTITGTWDDHWEIIYQGTTSGQEVYTTTNSLILHSG